MSFYYIYILKSEKDSQWYTGYTSNLRRRLKEHKEGLCSSTKNRRPLKLIYFEGCISKKDAVAREKYLKSGMGKRYLRNRMKEFFKQED
jgi:putative endonuclease